MIASPPKAGTQFQGSLPALVTPMKSGKVDEGALRDLVEWQLAEGSDGLVPCGTTGEGATLDADERARVIGLVVKAAAGKAPVLAGAGSNSTRECIESVKRAKEQGADGALVVTPYYNKPTQEGLYQHYLAIHEATRFPIVAYNVPSRTSVDMLPETVARVAKAGAIVGIKEATASMERQLQLVERIGPDAIAYLSGDDFTVLPYLACGGCGVISVVANCAPRQMKALVTAARAGEAAKALALQAAMGPLNRTMFVETNPGPVKAAVHFLGRCAAEIRLPLVWPAEASLAKIREAMVGAGLLP